MLRSSVTVLTVVLSESTVVVRVPICWRASLRFLVRLAISSSWLLSWLLSAVMVACRFLLLRFEALRRCSSWASCSRRCWSVAWMAAMSASICARCEPVSPEMPSVTVSMFSSRLIWSMFDDMSLTRLRSWSRSATAVSSSSRVASCRACSEVTLSSVCFFEHEASRAATASSITNFFISVVFLNYSVSMRYLFLCTLASVAVRPCTIITISPRGLFVR